MKNLDCLMSEEELAMSADDYQVGGEHYMEMDVEPWAVMKAILTYEEWIGYLKGNCIKYGMRAGKKEQGGVDRDKFYHYEHKLKEELGQ